MSVILKKITVFLVFLYLLTGALYSQEINRPTRNNKSGFHLFVNNNVAVLFSSGDSDDGDATGFGATLSGQYTTPSNFTFGVETGYYGLRNDYYDDSSSIDTIFAVTLIPLYAVAEYQFKLINNFYISPVLKLGLSYTRVRENGWDGDEYVLPVFETGVRLKTYFLKGLMLQANLSYMGIVAGETYVQVVHMGIGLGF